MNYLTLDEIKRQCNIDLEYTGDDEYLELIGQSVEDITANLLDTSLDDLCANYGELPAGVRHCMRMLCDYTYSQQRGSSSESNDIPNAVMTILKLYRNFN